MHPEQNNTGIHCKISRDLFQREWKKTYYNQLLLLFLWHLLSFHLSMQHSWSALCLLGIHQQGMEYSWPVVRVVGTGQQDMVDNQNYPSILQQHSLFLKFKLIITSHGSLICIRWPGGCHMLAWIRHAPSPWETKCP